MNVSGAKPLSEWTLVGLTGTFDRVGGAERSFRRIVGGLAERTGISPLYVAHLPPREEPPAGNARILRRPDEHPLTMVWRLRQILKSVRRPALLFPFQIGSNIIGSLANLSLPPRLRLPAILNDRNQIDRKLYLDPSAPLSAQAHQWLYRAAARVSYRRADRIVCNSRANAMLVERLVGTPGPLVSSVRNPVQVDELVARFPDRDRTRLGSHPLITAHGRLVTAKGWSTLIEAFALVRGRYPESRLRILGEGPQRPALEAMIAELGLRESCRLPGFQSEPLPAVEEGDVYVLPSIFEGSPNSLLEALALGLPCVASDSPGPAEILGSNGDNGLLFPVGDAQRLAAHLTTLFEDGELRQRLSVGARSRARAFTPDKCLEAYVQVLTEVTRKSRR